MCNTSLQSRPNFGNSPAEPLSLSTFQFLRNCNRFMIPPSDCHPYYNSAREISFNQLQTNETNLKNFEELHITNESPTKSPIVDVIETISLPAQTIECSNSNITTPNYDDKDHIPEQKLSKLPSLNATVPTIDLEHLQSLSSGPKSNDYQSLHLPSLSLFPSQGTNSFHSSNKSTLPAFEYITAANPSPTYNSDFALMELNRFGGMFPAFLHRRPRGEKRPIPEEQKDEKYYERRKRNNEAAKKSRDARKIREDRIAFRAALLEQENSILRAQILALRDELRAVRQLMNNSIATTVFPERTSTLFESGST